MCIKTGTCEICGTTFECSYKHNYKKIRKTCSDKCFKILMNKIKDDKIEKKCKFCQNPFFVKRSREHSKEHGNYCSKKCSYEGRKQTTEYVEIVCKTCQKKFLVNKKRLEHYKKTYKSENIFTYCSRECHLFSNEKTGIEKIVENILIKNNVKYSYNTLKLNKFIFDFHLLDYNILIECDGYYWHNLFFSVNANKEQCIKSSRKDLQKTLLSITSGYTLLRFKEYDIYESPDLIEQIILETIVMVVVGSG